MHRQNALAVTAPKPNGPGPERIFAILALAIHIPLSFLKITEMSHGMTVTHIATRMLTPFGYDIPLCGAMCFSLTYAQMIAASLYLMESDDDTPRRRALKALAGSGWIIATALELALAALSVDGIVQQGLSVAMASLLAIFETLTGILVIDCLLIPGSLGFAAMLKRLMRKR